MKETKVEYVCDKCGATTTTIEHIMPHGWGQIGVEHWGEYQYFHLCPKHRKEFFHFMRTVKA